MEKRVSIAREHKVLVAESPSPSRFSTPCTSLHDLTLAVDDGIHKLLLLRVSIQVRTLPLQQAPFPTPFPFAMPCARVRWLEESSV